MEKETMPKIEAVDIFYLRGPEVLDISDNSQDATLIRISAGGQVGWGECDASPLPSIGALVGPMSHVACRPVRDSVLGEALDDPADIAARFVPEKVLHVIDRKEMRHQQVPSRLAGHQAQGHLDLLLPVGIGVSQERVEVNHTSPYAVHVRGHAQRGKGAN